MSFTIIAQLSQLISNSVIALEKTCQENELKFPDLNATTFTPESEAFRSNPIAAQAARVAASACLQLVAWLLPPTDVMYRHVVGISMRCIYVIYAIMTQLYYWIISTKYLDPFRCDGPNLCSQPYRTCDT
ncbi:hypothetical protein BDQ17DRAFT_921665 [Cyathus striatus]|nr:hypothetical protein BDQ17DRAFT_921665 [Cyathus striatus]